MNFSRKTITSCTFKNRLRFSLNPNIFIQLRQRPNLNYNLDSFTNFVSLLLTLFMQVCLLCFCVGKREREETSRKKMDKKRKTNELKKSPKSRVKWLMYSICFILFVTEILFLAISNFCVIHKLLNIQLTWNARKIDPPHLIKLSLSQNCHICLKKKKKKNLFID